eukprot:2463840-Alexandrium_andersonii.AAC.1
MRRSLDNPGCPPEALARWARCKSQSQKRDFLQDWKEDPSWGTIQLKESKTVTDVKERDKAHEWLMRSEMLEVKKWPVDYVDSICKKKAHTDECAANPEFPDKKEYS